MKQLGARHLFLQWSVHYEHNQNWFSQAYGGKASADFKLYPGSKSEVNGIPSRSWGERDPLSDSTLTYLLGSCEKNEISLWIGLYLNESDESLNWWNAVNNRQFSYKDSLIIEHHIQRSINTIDELSRLYGTSSAFEGVYISFEIANHAFLPLENQNYLISIFNRITNQVKKQIPGKRVAISPFFNTKLSTAKEFGDMWENVLSNSDIDLFILQDGVGVEPKTLTFFRDKVSPFFKEAQRATKKSDTEFWINCEIFTNSKDRENPKLITGKMSSIKRQLKRAAKYCDTIVSFDFSYLDPNCDHAKDDKVCKSRKILNKSYRRYRSKIEK